MRTHQINRIIAQILALALLALPFATALSITLTITARGAQESVISEESIFENCTVNPDTSSESCVNQTVRSEQLEQKPWSSKKQISGECGVSCKYRMPNFNAPEEVTVDDYTLSFDSAQPYDFRFSETNSTVTDDPDDTILVVAQKQSTDKVIMIERIVPKNLSLGLQQVNILVKNGFVTEISSVSAEITGQGVRTVSVIPVPSIAPAEKDYIFVTVNATESGTHDAIIKLSAATPEGKVFVSKIEQFSVEFMKVEPSSGDPQLNASSLSAQLSQSREQLKDYDAEYLDKRAKGFMVSEVYDAIKGVKENVENEQMALSEDRLADVQKYLLRAQLGLEEVKSGLQNARTEQKSWSESLKDNALLITTVIAAFAAVIGLIDRQRRRIRRLRRKLAARREMEEKEKLAREEEMNVKKSSRKRKGGKKKKKRADAEISIPSSDEGSELPDSP